MELAEGMDPDKRFRCDSCGNLTRFDLDVIERTRRFWHAEPSGEGHVEGEEVVSREVVEAICHWCGHGSGVEVVDAPGAVEVAGRE